MIIKHLRNIGDKMKKDELNQFLQNFNLKLDQIHDEIGNLKDAMGGSQFGALLSNIKMTILELNSNQKRLEMMTNEVKGCVAIARGALQERRKLETDQAVKVLTRVLNEIVDEEGS